MTHKKGLAWKLPSTALRLTLGKACFVSVQRSAGEDFWTLWRLQKWCAWWETVRRSVCGWMPNRLYRQLREASMFAQCVNTTFKTKLQYNTSHFQNCFGTPFHSGIPNTHCMFLNVWSMNHTDNLARHCLSQKYESLTVSPDIAAYPQSISNDVYEGINPAGVQCCCAGQSCGSCNNRH